MKMLDMTAQGWCCALESGESSRSAKVKCAEPQEPRSRGQARFGVIRDEKTSFRRNCSWSTLSSLITPAGTQMSRDIVNSQSKGWSNNGASPVPLGPKPWLLLSPAPLLSLPPVAYISYCGCSRNGSRYEYTRSWCYQLHRVTNMAPAFNLLQEHLPTISLSSIQLSFLHTHSHTLSL